MALDAISAPPSSGKGPSYNEDMNLLNAEEPKVGGEEESEESEESEDSDEEESDREESDESEEEDEDEEEEDSDEKKKKSKKKDDDEEDEEESDDEEETVKIPGNRPTIKDIKTKYPEFFKDFPELKESYFRELEFTKLFPTIDEAKEAFQDNEAFSNLSDAALSGNPEPLLDSIEKTDKKAFETFAHSFLPTLFKKNADLYYATVIPLFENALRKAHKEGDENMKNSATNIAQFLFGENGEDSVTGKKTLAKSHDITAEQKKLNDAKDAQVSEGFRKTYSHVEAEIDKNLTILISKAIDPDKSLSKLLRGNLSSEVIKRIKKQLESDTAHGAVMGARWKRAKSNGYTEDDKVKIISTFLARAKSLIPMTSEKVRLSALGKNVHKQEPKIHKETNGGRVSRSSQVPGKKLDYSKMSDMEILNS